MNIKPFANESEVLTIDGLDVENRADRVTLTGQLAITRDREGLSNAKRLQEVLNKIINTLENENLSEPVKDKPTTKVKSPFN